MEPCVGHKFIVKWAATAFKLVDSSRNIFVLRNWLLKAITTALVSVEEINIMENALLHYASFRCGGEDKHHFMLLVLD